MVSRLERLAPYYRQKGFEDIAKGVDVLAKKAREAGMPDRFVADPRPKGPLIPELAQRLNVSGSLLEDNLDLNTVASWAYVHEPSDIKDQRQLEWNEILKSLNSTQRNTIRGILRFGGSRLGFKTVGSLRNVSVEELAEVRWYGKQRFGPNRAAFIKAVFERSTENPQTS